MGLSETIQKAAQVAFKAIGDIPLTCVYTSKGASVYDPATGKNTSLDLEYPNLKFLFEDFTAQEIDGAVILATDQKASIPQLNLEPVPKITDYITDSDSKKWTVENKKIDAAKALWIFQVRKSGALT